MAVLAERWYEWLYQFKIMEGLAADDTSDEVKIKRILAGASSLIEERTGDRQFYPIIATKTFDYAGRYDLNFDMDLLELTTITNGDGSTVTVANCTLYPLETTWKRRMHIDASSGDAFAFDMEPHGAISIAGVWGYWDTVEDSADAVNQPTLAADAVEVTVTDADLFDIGQIIKVNDEAMFVSGRNTSTNKLTIERAKLGTTAAAHTTADTIYIYRAPLEIELATSIISARMFKRWEAVWADSMGTGPSRRTFTRGFPPEVIDLIMPHTWFAV